MPRRSFYARGVQKPSPTSVEDAANPLNWAQNSPARTLNEHFSLGSFHLSLRRAD